MDVAIGLAGALLALIVVLAVVVSRPSPPVAGPRVAPAKSCHHARTTTFNTDGVWREHCLICHQTVVVPPPRMDF